MVGPDPKARDDIKRRIEKHHTWLLKFQRKYGSTDDDTGLYLLPESDLYDWKEEEESDLSGDEGPEEEGDDEDAMDTSNQGSKVSARDFSCQRLRSTRESLLTSVTAALCSLSVQAGAAAEGTAGPGGSDSSIDFEEDSEETRNRKVDAANKLKEAKMKRQIAQGVDLTTDMNYDGKGVSRQVTPSVEYLLRPVRSPCADSSLAVPVCHTVSTRSGTDQPGLRCA